MQSVPPNRPSSGPIRLLEAPGSSEVPLKASRRVPFKGLLCEVSEGLRELRVHGFRV